jgi:MFS family permease
MFLEFFVWGAWIVPISSYMNATLGFSGTQIGWICGASALGALISPVFVGYVADRFFATERILGALHLAGAACLFLAASPRTLGGVSPFVNNQAISIFKEFHWTEARFARIQAQVSNPLNHPVFAAPNVQFGSQSFGVISGTANGARSIQMIFKLFF